MSVELLDINEKIILCKKVKQTKKVKNFSSEKCILIRKINIFFSLSINFATSFVLQYFDENAMHHYE